MDEFRWEGRSITVGRGNYVLVTLLSLSTWIHHCTKVLIDVFWSSTAPLRNFSTSPVYFNRRQNDGNTGLRGRVGRSEVKQFSLWSCDIGLGCRGRLYSGESVAVLHGQSLIIRRLTFAQRVIRPCFLFSVKISR
jgi:hypothetical protein